MLARPSFRSTWQPQHARCPANTCTSRVLLLHHVLPVDHLSQQQLPSSSSSSSSSSHRPRRRLGGGPARRCAARCSRPPARPCWPPRPPGRARWRPGLPSPLLLPLRPRPPRSRIRYGDGSWGWPSPEAPPWQGDRPPTVLLLATQAPMPPASELSPDELATVHLFRENTCGAQSSPPITPPPPPTHLPTPPPPTYPPHPPTCRVGRMCAASPLQRRADLVAVLTLPPG